MKLDVLCDWIEASVLFDEDELSVADIVDALCEENIYKKQELAFEMVGNAWTELRRRSSWIRAGFPLTLRSSRISRRVSWEDVAPHSFCLLLCLAKWYRSWAREFGSDYTEQGEIFEELTKESLSRQFSGWQIHRTGWSKTNLKKLSEVVRFVAEKLGEPMGHIRRWTKPDANEAGLDLLCYRPFRDERVGVPVYLMQCASGGNWKDKLHTPNLNLWRQIVQFTTKPTKAFSTPFAFLDDAFIRNCTLIEGMLLDRYRLLAPAMDNAAWISMPLKERIIDWAAPRVSALPCRDA
ncbi:MAG: hypothetical protein ACE5JS_18690 [Nitrospinota bacterium]